jgi:hypothetical protein
MPNPLHRQKSSDARLGVEDANRRFYDAFMSGRIQVGQQGRAGLIWLLAGYQCMHGSCPKHGMFAACMRAKAGPCRPTPPFPPDSPPTSLCLFPSLPALPHRTWRRCGVRGSMCKWSTHWAAA